MRIFQAADSNGGISPVIGVILMVAIVVVLAALIGVYALELSDSTESNVTAGVETDTTEEGVQVRLNSSGNAEEVIVLVNGSQLDGSKLDATGDSVTVATGADDTVTVVGVGPDGKEDTLQTVEPEEDTTGGSGDPTLVSGGEQAENHPLGSGLVITIDTTNTGETSNDAFEIPVGDAYTGGEYSVSTNGEIDTGITDDLDNTTGDTYISFEEPGTYQVHISDGVQHIAFGSGIDTDAGKVESIEQWGDVEWKSTAEMFGYADNLTYNTTDTPNLSNTESAKGMFEDTQNFTGNESIGEWNTSNIKNMSGMFSDTNFNQDISDWDTGNVRSMRYMFYYNREFNQDISDWDTSNVEDMSFMFASATSFNQDISDWDTGNVRYMQEMFFQNDTYNNGGEPLDWEDTSEVRNMRAMFDGNSTKGSFNQDVSSWDTGNVKNMERMFSDTEFNKDISNWDTSNVENMDSMFAKSDFNKDISSWCVSQFEDEPLGFDDETPLEDNSSKQPNWGDPC